VAKFNTSTGASMKTSTHEGGESYKLSNELDLYATVCTTVLQPKFYESETDMLKRIRELVPKCDPAFVENLAAYARNEMYLRTVPVVLLGELAKLKRLHARTVARVIQRPDEIGEALAYYAQLNNGKLKPLSNQLKHGIAESLLKFDAYQLSKYNRDSKVTLKDALLLTHPARPTPEHKALFDQIINDQLVAPDTWEVALSAAGSDKEKKRSVWERLVAERKLGYMATLRNLRNMLDIGVSQVTLDAVCSYLANPVAVRNSKQFPFRFYSAYRELEGNASPSARQVLNAIEDAMVLSVQNYPGFEAGTRVLVIYDTSSSMDTKLSAKGAASYRDVGKVLGGLATTLSPQSTVVCFGDSMAVETAPRKGSILSWVSDTRAENAVGHATNAHVPFNWMLSEGKQFDKVLLFSDLQCWPVNNAPSTSWNYSGGYASVSGSRSVATAWREYRQKVNPDAKLYSFDLAGYGRGSPVNVLGGENAYLLAGWSDRLFEMLHHMERGSSVVQAIRNYDGPTPKVVAAAETDENEL
jgi:60 kDa SS-A/Ro ribonucleoprotein